MFTVQNNSTRRAAGFLWGLAVAALCGGGALESQAQPAPSNDDLANAQGILGVSGTAQGTNLNATVQVGEPAPLTTVPAQSTIWYVWTAPITTVIDFNTRNSTITNSGAPLGTTLAVYKLKNTGAAVAFANLTQVVGDQNDANPDYQTSRVDFRASLGTTYFIQVGSASNIQGYPVLNWGPSLSAGGFGFSSATYQMSSLENWLPDNDGSVTPSIYGSTQGSANARFTVTRTGGNIGRCQVTLNVGTAYYTNIYTSNYVITNILITNYSGLPATPANEISYSNIYITNLAWVNYFGDAVNGGFVDQVAEGAEILVVTNYGVLPYGPFVSLGPYIYPIDTAKLGQFDFFTNFPCPINPPLVPANSYVLVSNTDGTYTGYTTNRICQQTNVTVVVPAAIPSYQFTPFTETLIFDDYQMSQDVYVQLYPGLATIANGGDRDPAIYPSVVDYPTYGAEDNTNYVSELDYTYPGLNGLVQLSLTNAILDPQENLDILPPTITRTNAYIDILNFYGNPNVTYSNTANETILMNLERYTWRCNKNCHTAVVWLQQSYRDFAAAATHILHYTIDSRNINITWIDDNKFATLADSDYAVPSAGQSDFDFLPPLTAGAAYTNVDGALRYVPTTTTWVAPSGTITFPEDFIDARGIYIPITNNAAVEFDEDIEIQLYLTTGDAQSDAGANPPAFLGAINTGRLTINFDYNGVATQPGGAVDKYYNLDDFNTSQPPDNLQPGANAAVNSVAIDSIGRAVIGGDFDSYNDTPINFVARVLTTGFIDSTFTAGLGRGPNYFVNAVAIDSAGRIIIGGEFTSVNGTNASFIARLLSNGALDTNFATGFGFNGYVYALAMDAGGNILVGGDFTSFNKTNCNHIARLLPSGGLDTSFLPSSGVGVSNGTDQAVYAVTTDNLGNVILGGAFNFVNGTNWNRIARLLPNGNLDSSFNPGFGADGHVQAVVVQSDNSIILGGAFQNFNLISRNSIARLTPAGVLDTSFAPGSGFNDIVYSLDVQPDGNILVGGQFTMYNGTRRVGLARLLGGQLSNPGEGGWLDTSFMDTAYNQFAGVINPYYNTNAYTTNGSSLTGYYPSSYNQRNQVLALALQADGNVIIGGNFTRLGGGFERDDVRVRLNVARIIGQATAGPEEGGIGNCPGNLGMTQNPYSVGDTGSRLFVSLDRQNGSLGPLEATLGTNTLPASSSSATSADFGLYGAGVGETVSLYDTVWNIQDEGPGAYGWRMSDGEYGLNNESQPITITGGGPNLFVKINNDPNAAPTIYADLTLLNLTSSNLLSLGGVPIPLGPALGQYTAQLDIINNNFPAGTIGFSATNYNVLESASNVTIILLRTDGSYGQVSVQPNYINATAVNSNDFTWQSVKPVQFGNGVTSNSFQIPIIDHATQQSNKFFYIYLSSPTGNALLDTSVPPLVPSNSIVTIIDDHFLPGYLSFSSAAYSVLKPGVATISVSRSGAALEQVSVEVGASNGTAINGVNYVGVSNITLSWLSGEISPKTFTVQTLQDGTVDGPKTVNLYMYNPLVGGSSNATSQQLLISPSNAVLTIIDTDTNGYLNFLTHNFSVFQNAGQALITVTRSGLGTLVGSETVNFTTFYTNVQLPYLPAVAGSNYGFTNGQLTFGPGITSASFSVPVYQTSETSPADRIVGLRLFNGSPTNIAGLFPETAVLTILDPLLHINSAGSVDTTTQNGVGFNTYVNSLSLQPDSSILAGGEFTSFNGYPFDYVARLLPSGAFDTGFLFNLSGASGTVWQALSLPPSAGQVDGNIMIVGDFAQVNTVNSLNIARLNLNGSLDVSFNPGSGADGAIFAITNMFLSNATNGVITNYVIGGAFANYNGNPASGVARVTSTGLFDSSFNLGFGATGSNAVVHTLAITPYNQILVGGDFTSFNNQTRHYLVELNEDGTLNTNFAAFDGVSSDINGSVRALLVQPDGRILIGGLFSAVNGRNFNYIARLNSDGSLDTNFNVGVGCNNNVQALALDDQLRILVGGAFTQASGVTRNGLTRLNPDGTVDPSINFGFGANGFVDTILLQTNDEIDVGGGFTSFDNVPENNFARLFGGANAGNGSIQFSQQTFGVSENATNATNAIIGIQRLGGTFGSPSVSANFFTSNNTSVLNEAVPGVNYVPTNVIVNFPLGETFELVQVPILNSGAIGPDLYVSLELTNPLSNTEEIGPAVSATLIITNNNDGLEFGAQGFNQTSSAGTVAIPIVRVGNTNLTVSVNVYTGTNGSATPFTNYVPATNTLVFYPGVVTNYWLITILNSPTTFQDTTVDLEMDDATNAVIASPSSAWLTIDSALTGPGYLFFSQTNYAVSEGATNAVITVLRTNGNADQVTVLLTTSPGTAVPGVNYSNATTTLTFPANVNMATDNIPIIQLTKAEPNTTVILGLSNPGGNPPPYLVSPTQAVLTISNDISAFSFNSASYFVSEGASTATLVILRTGPSAGAASVNYATYSPPTASETNGYAVPNVDYVPTSGTLVFPPGVTLETIPVAILQTTNVNPIISFQVLLQNPINAQVGVPGAATVGIISDVTGFTFATNAYTVGENGSNIVITVNRLNANTGSLSVNFATTSSGTNTAVAGVDYVATNGTLNFLDGQGTNNITVQILNPNLVESNKTFGLSLSSPTTNSYVVAPASTVVTITNVYVGLAFGSPSFTVSECATSAIIPVVLSGLTNSTIKVTYGTEDGSGIANVNYFPTNGFLQFLPGQTEANIYVTPINNHVIGPDHTVQLNLTNNYPVPPAVAGVQLLTPSTALLTIQECNGADIIKSGTAFVTGSNATTGAIYTTGVLFSNETATVLLGLRDISGSNADNLVANLVLSNGITSNAYSVLSNNYGTLIQNGPTKARPFTFTVMGTNGQNITATLNLRDSENPTNLNAVAFGFTIGGSTVSYTNTNTIFLPENTVAPTIATNSVAPGYGYPSLISVSGIPGLITKATVTFSNFGHSYPSDVDAVLEAPNGSNSILMSHCGSGFGVGYGLNYSHPIAPVTLIFDQTTSVHVPLTTVLTSGAFLPTTNTTEMPDLPPVPTNETVSVAPPEPPFGATYGANLSTFMGASPNGNWSLWLICDKTQDSGYISNGWILSLSTGVAVENDADLEVTITTNVQPTVDNMLTYFVTVTNFGPSSATNVMITDYLPADVEYLSNSITGTNLAVSNSTLTVTVTNDALYVGLPSLATNAGTKFALYVMPTNVGYIANVVTALASEPDPSSNNIITNIALVGPASANVAISLSSTNNPTMVGGNVIFVIAVTNNGPSDAGGVTNTVQLPGFVLNTNAFSPFSGTVVTNANGTITWTLLDLANGMEQTLTVATKAVLAGTNLCTASTSYGVYDPLKGNSFASIKIEVDPEPLLSISSASQPYELTWSALAANYSLQGAINLPPPNATNLWINIPVPLGTNGQYTFTLSTTNTYHFFRLSAQLP
jgi:uncharacterized delta-60 repeat protein/uncharacterized repeat protein (TIGR01451 family)